MKKIIYLLSIIFLLFSCRQEIKEDEIITDKEKLNNIISLNKLCNNIQELKWQEKKLSNENSFGPTDKILIASFKTDTVFIGVTLKNNMSNPELINDWMPESIKKALNGSGESYFAVADSLIIDYYNFGYIIFTKDKYMFIYLSRIDK